MRTIAVSGAADVRGLRGPLLLVRARMRRRPRRWVAPSLAIALAVACAGAVAAQSTIVGDKAARSVLAGLSPVDRTVRVTWQGPVTSSVSRQATHILTQPGLGSPSEVLALDQVRLGTIIVRPAAIVPLARWLGAAAVHRLGPCRAASCPMLLGGGGEVPRTLSTFGARIRIVGAARLVSPVPLGYLPDFDGHIPVLLTDDIAGLDALGGLSGVFRTHSWIAGLSLSGVHSWSLSALEDRLRRAQALLEASGGQFELTAPFSSLDAARAEAATAPTRLLLVGGGVLVSVLLFVVLAAIGLRHEQQAEVDRLRAAGGRLMHAIAFVVSEAAWISAVSLLAGYGLGVLVSALLSAHDGEPVGAILAHTLLTGDAVLAAVGAWLLATVVLACVALVRDRRVLDLLAVASLTALVVGLVLGSGSSHAWTGALVPLCCLAAGLVLFRTSGVILRAAERLLRRGDVTTRLALLSLARSGGPAGVAIAFMAMSTALAGFALSFRATLIRGTADQAADQVPLDALIAAGPTFATPLELASSSQWRALSHGMVFAVRRTSATFLSGSGSVTVSMLGVPADAIAGIHGWRASDGSAPLHVLAKRLRPIGPTRTAGPLVPGDTRSIALDGGSRRLDLLVTADLRNPQGLTRPLSLGTIGPGRGFVRGVLPAGRWEVEALELDESAGLAVTNGHQNGESPAPATQFAARVTLGPLIARDGRGHVVMRASLAGWRGVGAAASTGYGRLAASLVFQESGFPGVLRPSQPSDHRALPVLADPATATAAGPGGRIGLTVDDLPLQARIVGVLRRFPTIAAGAAGFIVAGEPALSDALDAQLPGQGRPDELWISTPQTHDLQAGLAQGPLAQLSASFRAPIERALRSQPLAAGVMRTLLVAGGLAAALAVLGMLLILGGPFRDRRIESDLETQGLGPGALRRELRWRVGLAAIAGIWPGLVIAVLVDRLAVSSVGAVESGAPEPPLVTVVPWLELLGLGVAVTLLCLLLGWASTARSFSNRRGRPPAPAAPSRGVTELVEDVVR